MAGNQVLLTFLGDSKQLDKTFGEVGKSAGGFQKDTESAWSKANKAAVVGSTVIVGAAVAVGTSLVNTGREGLKQEKALGQVFESMGGTGSEAFMQIGDAASDMSSRLGETETDIQAVQTKLGTFKNVWDQGAQGAENFNRATELAFDLEAAGFGAAESNVAQLGRALENPTQGMSALARAGVTFTDAEKEKIKALQESGDLLAAQEIVLQALESQVGGVAEATTDGGDRMAASWANFQDQLGRKLIPVFEQLMAIGMVVLEWASNNSDTLLKLGVVVVGLAGFVLAANAAWKVYTATKKAVTLATKGFTAAQWLLNAAMRANPIGLIITLLAGLVAGIVIAYNRSETFRNIVQGAMRGIQTAFGWVIDRGKQLVSFFTTATRQIARVFAPVANAISAPFRAAFNGVRSIWNSTVGKISFSIPSWVPGVGGKGFSFPKMHQGGIVPGSLGQESIAVLEAGERVTSARGSVGSSTLTLKSDGSKLMDLLIELIMEALRTNPEFRAQVGAA
jgi:hypothetical protein